MQDFKMWMRRTILHWHSVRVTNSLYMHIFRWDATVHPSNLNYSQLNMTKHKNWCFYIILLQLWVNIKQQIWKAHRESLCWTPVYPTLLQVPQKQLRPFPYGALYLQRSHSVLLHAQLNDTTYCILITPLPFCWRVCGVMPFIMPDMSLRSYQTHFLLWRVHSQHLQCIFKFTSRVYFNRVSHIYATSPELS